MEKITIKELNIKNAEEIAMVHIDAFPNSILTKLGIECVKRYYMWQFTDIKIFDKKIFALGVYDCDALVAFSIFGNPRNAKIGFLRKNKFFLIGEVLKNLKLFNLLEMRTILNGAFYLIKKLFNSKFNNQKKKNEANNSTLGFLATATLKKYEGRGFGTLFIKKAKSIASLHNYEYMSLTVRKENLNAIKIYEINGFGKVMDSNGNWVDGKMIKKI